MKVLVQIAFVAMISSISQNALSDDVEQAIKEATQHYKGGALSQAASQLDYASSLIRQKQGELILAVFPEALSGWEAEEASSEIGSAMLGVGITASQSYYKGDHRVFIELSYDSPIVQSMLPMISNPAMVVAQGGKLINVQGNKALYLKEYEDIRITIVINNKSLITIEGPAKIEKDVLKYAEALNLDVIK